MDSFGILGNGFVGNAIYQGMKEQYKIRIFDINRNKSNCSFDNFDEEAIVFVCLPTPMNEDGTIDISILKSAISKLTEYKTLVIKSTITPAAAEELIRDNPYQRFVFNPEFLTERTAVKDFKNPSRIVLGGDKEYVDTIEKLYRKVFPSRLIEIIKTDAKTACFIKYFCNCFFAAKVSLMNEFRQIADISGVDWDVALNGLLSSGWVNPMHTMVPGPDGDFGFGGKCFPKDINAMIKFIESNNVEPVMLKAAWNKNAEIRKNLNWLLIDGAVSKKEK